MLTKTKLSAEKRIELIHVSLMRNKKFALFAGLFMVGTTKVVDDPFVTAYTNGRDAGYGREFADSLKDKELAFLVLHENMHKCYRHLTTWRSLYEIDRSLANSACDYVINLMLVEMDPEEEVIAFPRDPKTGNRMGLYDERFRGMDTKQVFDILREEQEEGGGGNGDDEGNGGQSDNGSGSPTRGRSDGEPRRDGGFDQHDWEGAKELSEAEKKQLADDIDQALRQGGIYAGKVGGTMDRSIAELLAPQVDWRAVLRRFVKTHLKDRDAPSWRKAHRNYLWQDVILPAIIGKRMKHLVVAIDTSGSVQGPLLTAFISELNKIIEDINPERLDVLYWDTAVENHETYTSGKKEVVNKTKPRGGGGTDPNCAVLYMKKHKINPDALIMLSDGYMGSDPSDWGGINYPSLWCIIGNENYKTPHGQLLVVKGD